jgi:hypothetical protein
VGDAQDLERENQAQALIIRSKNAAFLDAQKKLKAASASAGTIRSPSRTSINSHLWVQSRSKDTAWWFWSWAWPGHLSSRSQGHQTKCRCCAVSQAAECGRQQ